MPIAKKYNRKKDLINHILICLDASGSMQYHWGKVPMLVEGLRTASLTEKKQTSRSKTLISLLTFSGNSVTTHCTDVPVEDFKFPAINPSGGTPLLDSIQAAYTLGRPIELAKQNYKTQDHAFLCYLITDGEENTSRAAPHTIAGIINGCGERWTFAALVPNSFSVGYVRRFGYAIGNIKIWDTNSASAMEDTSKVIHDSYSGYMSARSQGATRSVGLFMVDASAISTRSAQSHLKQVGGRMVRVNADSVIREFVESNTNRGYVIGKAYYELSKLEILQPQKKIVIVENKLGGRQFGGDDARQMLGLPVGAQCKIKPGDTGGWRVFVQSTSVNRKLIAGTFIFIED